MGGNIYFSETSNNRVRRIGSDGVLRTFAGTGVRGFSGNGGPAINAQLAEPSGLAARADGTLYIADSVNNVVRVVTPGGRIEAFAGSGQAGNDGDRSSATAARMTFPTLVTIEASGSVLLMANYSFRRVGTDGVITTLVEVQTGFGGDGGPVSKAAVRAVQGLAADTSGNIYMADSGNARIRKVAAVKQGC